MSGLTRPFILKRNGQVVDRLNGNYVGYVSRASSTAGWRAVTAGRLVALGDSRWWAAEQLWEHHVAQRAAS